MRHTLAMLCLVAVACHPQSGEDDGPTGRSSLAIKAGVADTASKAVVLTGSDAYACTGFFVARNVVLTASHCVAAQVPDRGCGPYPTKLKAAKDIKVLLADAFDDPKYAYATVDRIEPLADAPSICGSDVAALVLKKPADVEPIVPRLDAPPSVGEKATAIGFGNTDPADADSSGRRHRLDGVTVTALGAGAPQAAAGAYDGDFRVSNGPCAGDSGGPLIDAKGLAFGVMSRGPSALCEDMIYERLDERREWLVKVVRDAAEANAIDPPTWAALPSAPVPQGTPDADAGTSAPEPSASNSGCSATRGVRPDPWIVSFVVGVAAVVAGVRRSRRRAR